MIVFRNHFLKLIIIALALQVVVLNQALAKTQLQAPVLIDGITLGEVAVTFTDPLKDLLLSKSEADGIFGPIVKETKWNRLMQIESNEVSFQELARIDIRCEWNESTLSISCVVPLDIRKIQDLNLLHSLLQNGSVLSSDPYSGYLNLSAIKSYTKTTSTTINSMPVDPIQAQAELVQRLNSVTLESTAYYLENEIHPWERGDTSLVYDYQPSSIRFRLGDFNPGAVGYLNSISMGGLLIQKQFAIDPLNPATALLSTIVYLKNPSLVEVSVNRILITRVKLPAGPFNLKDLPLLNGRNKVDVKTTDDFGAVQEFSVDLFFEGTLLGKGVSDFSYSVGEPSAIITREKQYSSKKIATFYHRHGLSDQWTLGLNGQNLDDQNLFGLESNILFPKVYIQFDQVWSKNQSNTGLATHLRLKTTDQYEGNLANTRFYLDLENKSSTFLTVTTTPPVYSEYSYKSQAFLQNQLSSYLSLNFNGGYQWGQNGYEDARLYGTSIQISLPYNIHFDFSYNQTVRHQTDEQWSLNLSWFENTGVHSASGFYDSVSKSTMLNAHRNATHLNNDFSLDLTSQTSSESQQVDFKTNYLASQGELQFAHQYFYANTETTNRSQLQASTAIAWTKGHFAFSRPITDSFAMLVTNEIPEGSYLIINPGIDFSEATMKSWKSLVLPNLTSYERSALIVDSTNLPPGTSLQNEAYLIKPTYRSGVYIDLSLEKALFVKGSLIKADGQPLSYVSGSIYNEKNQLITDSFFTDAQGRFILDQLKVGKYKLVLHESGWNNIAINLTSETSQQIELGSLMVERTEGM